MGPPGGRGRRIDRGLGFGLRLDMNELVSLAIISGIVTEDFFRQPLDDLIGEVALTDAEFDQRIGGNAVVPGPVTQSRRSRPHRDAATCRRGRRWCRWSYSADHLLGDPLGLLRRLFLAAAADLDFFAFLAFFAMIYTPVGGLVALDIFSMSSRLSGGSRGVGGPRRASMLRSMAGTLADGFLGRRPRTWQLTRPSA